MVKSYQLPAVLSIAGLDPSGGAGIAADLKTTLAYGIYGMAATTAVTAQNTCGVSGIWDLPYEAVYEQIDTVFQDIRPNAVKVGMLSTSAAAQAVADIVEKYAPEHMIIDPVMVSTSGKSLLDAEARQILLTDLFQAVELITPNIPECENILGQTIQNQQEMEEAAIRINKIYGCNVLIKGGHLTDTADDLLYTGEMHWYPSERIKSANTHGTGCTLSTAIACGLACGKQLPEAVRDAKKYVRDAMKAGLDMGQGNGPLAHGCYGREVRIQKEK